MVLAIALILTVLMTVHALGDAPSSPVIERAGLLPLTPLLRSKSLPAQFDHQDPRALRLFQRLHVASARIPHRPDRRALIVQGLRDSIEAASAAAWHAIAERDRIHAYFRQRMRENVARHGWDDVDGRNRVLEECERETAPWLAATTEHVWAIFRHREQLERLPLSQRERQWLQAMPGKVIVPLNRDYLGYRFMWNHDLHHGLE